jgi:hypothetical protein
MPEGKHACSPLHAEFNRDRERREREKGRGRERGGRSTQKKEII